MPKGRPTRPALRAASTGLRSGRARAHLVLMEVGLAGLRLGEGREGRSERLVVRVDTVGEDADQRRVEADRGVAPVEDPVGRSRDREELDLDDVVGQATAVREAAGVAAQDAETARGR